MPTHAPAGTTTLLDPRTLATEHNVRTAPNLDKDFLDSVKQHGVIVPVTVFWSDIIDGYQVLDGQRRTLAAVDQELTTIPAYIVDTVSDDQARIVTQLVVNEHRTPIAASEHVAAVKQLSLFGMPATMIAKKTNSRMGDVGNAIKISKSAIATEALTEMSIEHSAALVEFEDDSEAVERIRKVAREGGTVEHTIARLRSDRQDILARQTVLDEIASLGLNIILTAPGYGDTKMRKIADVYTGPKMSTAVSIETALAEARDDVHAYPKKTSGWGDLAVYEIGYAIANWETHGWFATNYGGTTPKGPLTDDEKAKRKQARENTKAWVPATKVRVEWLQGFVQRKQMPAGWEMFVTKALIANAASGYSPTQWRAITTILLGATKGDAARWSVSPMLDEYLQQHPNRAPQVAVAVVCGSIEGGYEFDKKGWQQGDTREYLQLLATWGYPLSELEQTITTEKAAA